jgi:hypothetical protein
LSIFSTYKIEHLFNETGITDIQMGLTMKFIKILTLAIITLGLISFDSKANSTGTVKDYSGWTYEIEPYLFINNIDGNAKIGLAPHSELNVDFDTIFDNLNMAGMIHFEAHHASGWGLVVDYAFMDLGQKDTNKTGGINKVSMRQGVLEALGLYRVKYGDNRVDYFSGIRWWDNDLSLSFALNEQDPFVDLAIEEDWVDIVVGARWYLPISKNWELVSRADIGGFGITSQFTSTVELGAIYHFSKSMRIDMKYKSSWVDYDNEELSRDTFIYETVTHGPLIGWIFEF